MTETETTTINEAFNVSDGRAQEIIKKYARGLFEKFLKREITTGALLSAFVDMDDLTTNEKCFLTAHCTDAANRAMQEAMKQIRIAQLIQEGIL